MMGNHSTSPPKVWLQEGCYLLLEKEKKSEKGMNAIQRKIKTLTLYSNKIDENKTNILHSGDTEFLNVCG